MMQPKDLRLGIIGLSEGNGHPYSWSAIFNGYNREVMAKCPYPVIPEYLSSQFFPHDAIQGAKVTHVWAQERAIAENIAAASLIPHIVSYYEDMIGQIDAILLARDDAENHLKMSIPFLDAGLPIYIDKPIALTLDDIESLYSYQQYNGQIFSCSAMRFSEELQLSALDRENLGDIGHIQAVIPKSWEKYGIHIIDPVLNMLQLYGKPCDVQSNRLDGVTVVTVKWLDLSATFTCLGSLSSEIKIRVFGNKGYKDLIFKNTFSAFKRTLEKFITSVKLKSEITTKNELVSAVSILQRGLL